jgi:hypothetical protein
MASPFWTYFHERLRFGLIDAPGPLQALTKGLAHRLDTVREDAVFLRAQWFAQLCEPELVPAFGLSRGLARHHTETPEQFRQRVINAYAWHMLGGKQEGLPEILRFYGYSVAEIENLRRYQPSRWAEFQVGLVNPEALADQNAILAGLETLVWLINEYKPARSVLFRLYTDIYNITPLVWSEGRWSDHYYSLFSGVPSTVLGPDFAGNDGLILSFGLRYGVESARPDGEFGKPVFAGLQRQGFITPYIDAMVWSHSRWSEAFPHKHGFAVGELLSVDWSERTTTSYPWGGYWDARMWAELSSWDRPLPQGEMHNKGISRVQLVYDDEFITAEAGGAASAGRWGGLNACWSVPTAMQVGRPMRWSAYHYSDSTARRLVVIHEQGKARLATASEAPEFAAPAAHIKGMSGAANEPLHRDAWDGAWDDRRWYNYIAYFAVTSTEEPLYE